MAYGRFILIGLLCLMLLSPAMALAGIVIPSLLWILLQSQIAMIRLIAPMSALTAAVVVFPLLHVLGTCLAVRVIPSTSESARFAIRCSFWTGLFAGAPLGLLGLAAAVSSYVIWSRHHRARR